MDTRVKEKGRRHPEETASFLSSLFFWWTLPIFWEGVKRDLEAKDLYDPLEWNKSEGLGDRLEREWKKELRRAEAEESAIEKNGVKSSTPKPNLLWAIARVFWVPYMRQGVLLLLQTVVLKMLQPILQKLIISFFNKGGDKPITKNEALLYSALLVIVTFSIVFVYRHTLQGSQRIGMSIRIACCSLVYRKVLHLNQTALNKTAPGQIANLISNDVARFDGAAFLLHYIWIMPIQILVIGYFMWQSVGVAALVGIFAMMVQTIPFQVYSRKLNSKLRSKTASKTDERVQLMSELISGIQVVKMYSWEKPFEVLVSKVRQLEIKYISYMSYLKALNHSIFVFAERFTLYITLITFALMGNSINPEITFVMVSLFQMLQFVCAIVFPQAMLFLGETSVSMRRLTEFLLLDEAKYGQDMTTGQQIKNGVTVVITRVTANWFHDQMPSTLSDLSLQVKSRSLCAVVGPVGSGKSSLLHLLLGELPVGAGTLSFFTGNNGDTRTSSSDIRISYASQDPWLFSASVRHNILFGLPYDEARYREVTRVCALHKDFEELPQGDLSFVGERGASLSGGQRARVNLARAVYRDADLYLLDDPLSAVDPRVGRHLFEECICGFLKDKTRILVTHQLQYLQQADTVIVLDRGIIEHQGTFDELSELHVHLFDSEGTDHHQESDEDKSDAYSNTDEKESFLPTESTAEVPESVSKDVNEEVKATGAMSIEVYRSYFSAGGNFCSLSILTVVFIAGQLAVNGTDYWVTYWTNQESLKASFQANKLTLDGNQEINGSDVDGKTYLAESQWYDQFGLMAPNLAIYVYTFCIVCCVVFVVSRNLLLMRVCMNASRNIHNSMFSSILKATMRFFNTNPSGRILNRFAKDVGAMDEQLSQELVDAVQTFVLIIGVVTMVIIINVWMMIPTVVIAVLLYILRNYYLKTAQNIKRLEGIEKSPVFSHMSSTLDGLTTIRSRGVEAEELLRKEFDCHQDAHTGAWYLSVTTTNAFLLFLDIISWMFLACVCFLFVVADDGTTLGGSFGLAISQSLILTSWVQHGMKHSTEVISQMTSVERILQYTNLPTERSFHSDNPPPSSWPSKGALLFKNVTMRYAESKPQVLKGLNVNIEPGWKVGVVGRTGAGKSSLIAALFRLTGDGLEGEIVLDGIDTGSLGLHELRPRISIIPQEPILFSASLRHNLDPFNEYEDAQLWDSLQEVQLGDAIPSLDSLVARGGANFSVGQRQLICLARAILRNNRILVLDEATANIDSKTDALIQKTIRRRFADCTVLTIAHRLNTIMDSNRVMVMAGGRIVEFGHPYLLVKNGDGYFSRMLRETGKTMSEKLTEIAENSFQLTMNPKIGKESQIAKESANTIIRNETTHL